MDFFQHHLTTYFRDHFKIPAVVGVSTLSYSLEGWCQGVDLRHSLDNIFKLASSWRLAVSPLRYCRYPWVITRALMNCVEVIASKRVLASVTKSGDQVRQPSAEMLSKQAIMEKWSSLIQSKASILSIHLILQRSLSFCTLDSGWVLCITSSNFFWCLGWVKKKTDSQFTMPVILQALASSNEATAAKFRQCEAQWV